MTSPEAFLLRRIESYVRKRTSTDRVMGSGWIIVPILPIVTGIALIAAVIGVVVSAISNLPQGEPPSAMLAGIFALYGFALIGLYMVLLVSAFPLFYFIDRRNNHFMRQKLLFAAISSYQQARKGSTFGENGAKLTQLADDAMFQEHDRPADLWAILYVFVTPIVGLVIAYSLTQDLRKHEERQGEYQQTLALACEEAGLSRPSFATYKPHNRDPMVYLILTAITAGLFWIYWFYILLKDYNEHFRDQWVFEDQILSSLKPSVTCTTCNGSIPHDAKFCPLCGASQSNT